MPRNAHVMKNVCRIWIAMSLLMSVVFGAPTAYSHILHRLIVRDNVGGIDTLWFGYVISATRCIDAGLGEQELPPAPPAGVFDARWVDPSAAHGFDCLGHGVKLHLTSLPEWGIIDTFKLRFQPGEQGYPFHFQWSFAAQDEYRFNTLLTDTLGGERVHIDMSSDTLFALADTTMKSLEIRIELTGIIAVEPPQDLPRTVELRQNVPNPFNPATVIGYALPVRSSATLKIYNVLGQKVATLLDDIVDAGWNSVTWDAGELPGGVYFYLLETTGENDRSVRFTGTGKMILLK